MHSSHEYDDFDGARDFGFSFAFHASVVCALDTRRVFLGFDFESICVEEVSRLTRSCDHLERPPCQKVDRNHLNFHLLLAYARLLCIVSFSRALLLLQNLRHFAFAWYLLLLSTYLKAGRPAYNVSGLTFGVTRSLTLCEKSTCIRWSSMSTPCILKYACSHSFWFSNSMNAY